MTQEDLTKALLGPLAAEAMARENMKASDDHDKSCVHRASARKIHGIVYCDCCEKDAL